MSDLRPEGIGWELPPAARAYRDSIPARESSGSRFGGSAARTHIEETGHRLRFGCCADPANLCRGCGDFLAHSAKVKGFVYCSRRCREIANA